MDDGLRYLIKKDLNIVYFNSKDYGNGFLLPAGPLRKVKKINDCQIAVINGRKYRIWKEIETFIKLS